MTGAEKTGSVAARYSNSGLGASVECREVAK